MTTKTFQLFLVALLNYNPNSVSLLFIIINNTLSLISSPHLCVDVEPCTGAWLTYQGSRLQRLITHPLSEAISYQYFLH